MSIINRALVLALFVALVSPLNADGINNNFTGSAPPSGSAGGDLGGTYPNPTVTNGSHITNASIPNSGLVSPPTAVGTAAVGQIPGTTTNDNASAGNVGEIISSLGGQVNATVTFTNGSAVIADTTACATNQRTGCIGIGNVLNLSTSVALPTNFAASTNYYVLAANFVPGVSYTVATTPGGTAIVAGSAGTGTQTRANSAIITNNSLFTVASATLSAGDWTCSGNTAIATTGTTTYGFSAITTANNSVTGKIIESTSQLDYGTGLLLGVTQQIPNAPVPISLAAPATYYLNVEAGFSTGTATGAGSLVCRRAR